MRTLVAATTAAAHWGSLPYCESSAAKVAAAKDNDGLGTGLVESVAGVEAGTTDAAAVLRSSSVIMAESSNEAVERLGDCGTEVGRLSVVALSASVTCKCSRISLGDVIA